jgi:hypothetical protein
MQGASFLVLERRISAERLAPFRAVVAGDLGRALALYEWNTKVAAAFWAVLADVEVVLRNAMHEQLTAWSSRMHGAVPRYLDGGSARPARTG